MQQLTVEIWSDIVCPWCYIGKRRFEAALARFAHREQVQLVWRSFELDPNTPRRTSGSLNDMLAQKMGVSRAQAAAMNAQVTGLAANEGLEYHLDQAQHGNTFDAHRLIHLAAAHGLQEAMTERLMRAYFTEGLPISDPDTLVTLGAEIGVPANTVRAMLDSDDYADAVRADEQRAAMLGIHGVPFFAINEQYGVSGAQPAETFLSVLEQVWDDSYSQPDEDTSMANAAACDDDSCVVATEEQTDHARGA